MKRPALPRSRSRGSNGFFRASHGQFFRLPRGCLNRFESLGSLQFHLRQDPVKPARQPLVGVPEQDHRRRYEHDPHDGGVDGDCSPSRRPFEAHDAGTVPRARSTHSSVRLRSSPRPRAAGSTARRRITAHSAGRPRFRDRRFVGCDVGDACQHLARAAFGHDESVLASGGDIGHFVVTYSIQSGSSSPKLRSSA
jgi:hypothetical protein